MLQEFRGALALAERLMHRLAFALIVVLALVLVGLSVAMALDVLPWPEIALAFGGASVAHAGQIVMLSLTGFAVALLFFLPAHGRMMRLETSHRSFGLTMEDIARAYRTAHEADRKALFKIGSEFDEVRERMAHLRQHPDLGALEPEVLELAARMSFQSRDLAKTYSDANVERARTFLRQRQEEIEKFQEQIDLAKRTCDELAHWLRQVEADEKVVDAQVAALEKDLMDILPRIGFELGFEERPVDPDDGTVVRMGDKKGTRAEPV